MEEEEATVASGLRTASRSVRSSSSTSAGRRIRGDANSECVREN